ncbi:FAD-binding protein [Pararhodobacter zhoushanensis]|uniref:FAD-binding protein n=1 Tax=Pararhodobacter zhoushanensis TaxID=2479545 RepID=A0ABT3GTF7_9RHOB|nr:FAD-binding protein [Pararhodobacter zhoushanensis]MCW1930822.1 FAD-binding protein [Pararhodobacter zhoushanensis]
MRPQTEAELAEAVRGAAGPLVVRGGGTRGIGRPVAGEVLETGGLSGVTLYEPGALTLVAKAGTPLAEVEAALAAEGQRLPFEPMDHRGLLGQGGEPTLGGMVAANASGPRRVQAGACRDSLIGVRFVDGTGAVIKNGGRVMKNVTGYDLVKLMAGSWGTLGVLSEVAFKLLPAPSSAATLVFDGLDSAQAVAMFAAALGSPFEVNGAAHLPDGRSVLRVEGFASSVTYRAGALGRHLARFGSPGVLDREESEPLWVSVRDVVPFHGGGGDVWRLSVKPSDAPGLVAKAGGEALYDWGGGLVWLRVAVGTDLRAALGAFQGHATLVRASADTRRALAPFQPEHAPVAALTRGLRAKFDPRGILNPGLME